MSDLNLLNKNFIMAHYFHDDKKFQKISGSVSKSKFAQIVKKNKNKNFIYTFDDCLKSQFYIAMPILNRFNQKGIFFMNTFQLENKFNYHEISKFFIKNYYKSIENFSKDFLSYLDTNFIFKKNEIKKIKTKSPFYNASEIKIRIVRSKNISLYNKILKKMFLLKKFNYKKFQKNIYMNKREIITLSKKHLIGLHTHSHPFNFEQLNKKKQFYEINKNKKILEKLIKNKIYLISYPVGRYNQNTLKILKYLKIFYGFKNNSLFETSSLKIPRLNINKL